MSGDRIVRNQRSADIQKGACNVSSRRAEGVDLVASDRAATNGKCAGADLSSRIDPHAQDARRIQANCRVGSNDHGDIAGRSHHAPTRHLRGDEQDRSCAVDRRSGD